jgi:hypothetical protein
MEESDQSRGEISNRRGEPLRDSKLFQRRRSVRAAALAASVALVLLKGRGLPAACDPIDPSLTPGRRLTPS